MNVYENMDWLLGGSYKDDDDKSKRASLIEELSFFIGKFSTTNINENDYNDIEAFEIYDEMSIIEEAFEKIQDKIYSQKSLDESMDTIATIIPAAISTIAGGLAIGSAMFKSWMNNGSVLPKGLQNAEAAIRRWIMEVTGTSRVQRKEHLARVLRKENPNASMIEIDAMISKILKGDTNVSTFIKPEDSAHFGTYDTEFARAFRHKNMTPKEKEAWLNKRFPNRGKKKDA